VQTGDQNNNWLNIRYNPANNWLGQTGASADGFVQFETPLHSLRASDRTLKNYKTRHGINTVQDVVARWAPPSDKNPTENYINFVSQKTGYAADSPLDLDDPTVRENLIAAMMQFETPDVFSRYSSDMLQQARGLNADDDSKPVTSDPDTAITLLKTSRKPPTSDPVAPSFGDLSNKDPSRELTQEAFGELSQKDQAFAPPQNWAAQEDDPIAIFRKSVRSGAYSQTANLNYFQAMAASAVSDKESMDNHLYDASVKEKEAAVYLSDVESLEEFFEEPTLGGFVNQAFGATGAFLPSAGASITAGLIGAGIAAVTTASAPVTLTTLAAGTVTSATAKIFANAYVKKTIGEAARKKLANEAAKKAGKKKLPYKLSPDEEELLEATYKKLQKEQLKKKSRNMVRGGLAGAATQEFPQGSGTAFGIFAEQGMTDPIQAFQSGAIGGAFTLIGVGSEGLILRNMMNIAKKTGGPLSRSFLRDTFIKGGLKSSAVEGFTELAQEELSVQQRFAIDSSYTQAQATLDRMSALFMGSVGGFGIGAAGGAGGSIIGSTKDTTSGVVNRAREMVKEAYEGEINSGIDKEQAGVETEVGQVAVEPISWLIAQLDATSDQKTGKNAVWIDQNTLDSISAEDGKALDAKLESGEFIGVKTDAGLLLTTDQQKAEAFKANYENDPGDTTKLDSMLVDILGYAHGRKVGDDIAVEVKDKAGNVVWYQSTNQNDLDAVYTQANKLFPADSDYEVSHTGAKEHLNQRSEKALEQGQLKDLNKAEQPELDLGTPDAQGPKKSNMDLDDLETSRELEKMQKRVDALLAKAQRLADQNVEKGLPAGGINNLSPKEQQILKQDYLALQETVAKRGAAVEDTGSVPQGQFQDQLSLLQEDDGEVEVDDDDVDFAGLDDRTASFAAGAMGATAYSPEIVMEGAGSKETPITSGSVEGTVTSKNSPNFGKDKSLLGEGWKGNDPSNTTSQTEAYQLAKDSAKNWLLGSQTLLLANINSDLYSSALLDAFSKRSENAGQAFYFDIIEIGEDANGTPLYGMHKYTLPGELDMKVEAASWVKQAKNKARNYVENKWTIKLPPTTNKDGTIKDSAPPQKVDMPKLTNLGRVYNNRTKQGGNLTQGNLETAFQGFSQAMSELLSQGYEVFWEGKPLSELTIAEQGQAIVYTSDKGQITYSMKVLSEERGEFNEDVTTLEKDLKAVEALIERLELQDKANQAAGYERTPDMQEAMDNAEKYRREIGIDLRDEQQGVASERNIERSKLGTVALNPGFDPFTDIEALEGESGVAGGKTGKQATVPVDQNRPQERTREKIAQQESKIKRIIEQDFNGLGTRHRNIDILIAAREVTLRDRNYETSSTTNKDKTQPTQYESTKIEAQNEIDQLKREQARLEKEMGISGNVFYLNELKTIGNKDPVLAQSTPGLDSRTKDIALGSTDVADVRAEIEFKSRNPNPYVYDADRKTTVQKYSEAIKQAFGDVSAVNAMLKIFKEDYKIDRNVYIYTADEIVGMSEFANAEIVNQINNEQQVVRGEKADEETGVTKRLGGRILSYNFGPGGTDIIILDIPKGATTEQLGKAHVALAHELGHSFQEQEFTNSLSPKNRQYDILLSNFLKFQKEQGIEYPGSLDPKTQARAMEEWAADQVAANLFDRTKQAKNGGEAIFKRMANRLRAFFQSMETVLKSDRFRKRFNVSPAFNEYITALVEERSKRVRIAPRRVPLSKFGQATIRNMVVEEVLDVAKKEAGSKGALAKLGRAAARASKSDATTAKWIKKVLGVGKEIALPTDNMLRQLGKDDPTTDAGVVLAQFFYGQSQTTELPGWVRTKQQKIYQYTNEVANILGFEGLSKVSPEAMEILFEAEDNNIDTADLKSEKAKEVRKFLETFYEKENVKKDGKMGKLSNYFPRSINLSEIENSPVLREKLVDLLVKFNKGKTFQDPGDSKPFSITPKVANQIVDLLLSDPENANVDLYSEAGKYSLGLSKARSDTFKAIPTLELRNAKNEKGHSLVVDPALALRNYLSSTIKRTELNKRGGAKEITRLINTLPPKEQEIAENMVQAIMGKVNPEMSNAFRVANSWGLTANIYSLLALTVFASFPDMAGPILRSKEFGGLKNVGKSLAAAFRNDAEAKRFAYATGSISTDALSMLNVNAGEMDYMTEGSKKANDFFFKYTVTEYFTRFTRIFAAGMAKEFILVHGERAGEQNAYGERSRRYLKELQLTPEDVKAWSNSGQSLEGEVGDKVKMAVFRFVDESIVRPNSAERPAWASDPRFALIWQLKSFFYAYGKTVVGGLARESQNRAKSEGLPAASVPLILAAVTMLPLTMLGFDLRERFKGGLAWAIPGVDSTQKNFRRSLDMDWGEYSVEILDRSGVLGAFALLLPLFQGGQYGDPFWISPLGPAFEKAWDLPQGKVKIDDFIPLVNQVGGFDREN
tara:strand:+ start:157 stop:7431 length:7275 start_codon:yes stop_codon:yes gene_type:complete